MDVRHAIPGLLCVVAILLVATSTLWHHPHTDGDHEHEDACAVCHAVLMTGQGDVPAPTALRFDEPLVCVMVVPLEPDSATRFVRESCARGPPRPDLA